MYLLNTALVLAQEESTSNVALVLPERAELIAGILAFGIVFFFVWRWALPTMNKTLEARNEAIAGKIAEAEKAKVEAENLLADYKSQLAEAKAHGNEIVEEARGAAQHVKDDMIARAESDAERIRIKARDEAETEKARALSDARAQVGDISVDLAGRIVGQSLDADAHKDLVERYLADLEKL